ncbi:MAG: LacI family DNA-binding transcriptional regulator [Verrucomicrobiota bacterium]
MPRPTLKDVCRQALVSEATVSRVINNSPLVHQRTRDRVLEVIRRLGYTPNAAARNLSRSRTDVIGVVFHQMSSGFFAQVMAGIDAAARENRYHLLCAFTRDDADPLPAYQRMVDEMRVDGVIILDPSLSPQFLAQLKMYQRPLVMIQRELEDAAISSISVDNRRGAYNGMKHLLSLGYRDLLVVKGPAGAQDAQLRLKGCEQALAEASQPPATCRQIDGGYAPHAALEAFREYRGRHGLPRAIFALNDAMALAILKELRETGVRVPQQVAIIGFDGIDCAGYVGLTTVETPMLELGKGAVGLFLQHVQSPDADARHVKLETRLAVRDTCGGKAS